MEAIHYNATLAPTGMAAYNLALQQVWNAVNGRMLIDLSMSLALPHQYEAHSMPTKPTLYYTLIILIRKDLFKGKYLSEGAAREWSTVVNISITPPSFKPVSLPLPRSPLSKTTQTSLF